MLSFRKRTDAIIRRIELRLPSYEQHSPAKISSVLFVAVLFLALSVFTRFGSVLTEVYNWDESTFIVVSSKVANGVLPYTDTWDIKPPGLFFLLGGSLAVFGNTLFTVRMFGAACVFIMALSTFFVSRRVMSFEASVGSGLFVVCAMTAGEAQAVYTETLSTALVMLGLCSLIYADKRTWLYLVGGALIGCAVITRTNMAFVALGLGLFYFARIWFVRNSPTVMPFMLFAVGGWSVLGLTLVPFYLQGQMHEFWFANVTVPLEYTSGQLPAVAILVLLLLTPLVVAACYPAVCGIPVFLIARSFRKSWFRTHPKRTILAIRTFLKTNREWWLIVFTGGLVVFGMCMNGAATWHHLIQVVPFLAIAAGSRLAQETRPIYKYLVLITVLGALVRTIPATSQVIWHGVKEIEETRPIAELAQEIRQDRGDEDQVFALSGQLVYWYLDQPPLNKFATHPSNALKPVFTNIWRKSGSAQTDLFHSILVENPKYVLTHPTMNTALKGDALRVATQYLDAGYEVWKTKAEFTVYRRKDS